MTTLPKDDHLSPFVKDILLMENLNSTSETDIPIYADGFPGIMYSKTNHSVILKPKGKKLSDFFLYGQTIEPITLNVTGPYRFIIFQIYPSAARLLLGVDPKDLKDDCFDLNQLSYMDTEATIKLLQGSTSKHKQVELITGYLFELVRNSSADSDKRIKLAVNLILSAKGNITIKEVRNRLYISERTFERHFTKEIGINPKQFANVVKFNYSLNQISEEDYSSLTEIGHESGFADQSHFIKTFKRFTGKTPKEFQKQLAK